jgi:hypothetical protein
MTIVIVAGIITIAVVAIVVGVVDAHRAADWRRIAAERREKWEERVRETHGGIEAPEPDWDDD